MIKAIDKAIPKFSSERANLVVTADDLFFSPVEMPQEILRPRVLRHLAEPGCACVGGVLNLYAVKVVGRPLEYRHYFIANPTAKRPLPQPVVQGLDNGNWRDAEGA